MSLKLHAWFWNVVRTVTYSVHLTFNFIFDAAIMQISYQMQVSSPHLQCTYVRLHGVNLTMIMSLPLQACMRWVLATLPAGGGGGGSGHLGGPPPPSSPQAGSNQSQDASGLSDSHLPTTSTPKNKHLLHVQVNELHEILFSVSKMLVSVCSCNFY